MIRSIGLALAIVGGTVVTIPSGTDIPVTLDENIPIESDKIGDTFEAHVTRDVVVNGEVVIPAGSPAEVRLVKNPEEADAASLSLSGIDVNGDMRSVSSEVAKADSEASGLSTGEKTAVGAAAGAVVGAVTGAGVLEGAVVGAGGGLAWGLLGKEGHAVPDDTPFRFPLKEDLKL